MLERFAATLHAQPVLLLFLVIGLGYLIGNIRVRGISLGPVAGVLFAGLVLGHYGYRLSPDAQALGFALFIFSVGYEAGPRFFDVLRTDGLKYFQLAVVIAVVGFTVAVLASGQMDLTPGTSAGLLAGGLTSSPTLAAAQEAIRAGSVTPPGGLSAEEVIGNITTGYAITYIFGLAGLIAIVTLLPRVLGLDLPALARELDEVQSGPQGTRTSHVCVRTFRITDPEYDGGLVADLLRKHWDGYSIGQLRRGGEVVPPDPANRLQLGDEVVVLAPAENFSRWISPLGEEIPTTSPLARVDSARIVVFRSEGIGQRLGDLQVARQYQVLLLHVMRSGLEIPRGDDVVLQRGDILEVTGPAERIDALGETLGHVERNVPETDMLTFAAGVAGGVAVGTLSVSIGGVSIGLGSAGGLVASGILIGFLHSVSPRFGRLPEAVRWIFMEFGLLLFMAGVGLRAGGEIVETFMQAGPQLVLAGVAVTTFPVLIGYLYGRKVLGLNPVLLLGGITGSMTSGAALSIVTKAAKSNAPALGYTGAYAFANILLTIAGSLILLL
jgi:putative transport protein